MALETVDTRGWNLGGVAICAAMVGCGPSITLDDDTGADTGLDEGPDDGPPTTTTPPPQCVSDDDCTPGAICSPNGVCEHTSDTYDCGGCCDDGCGYDDYYYDCYADEDCAAGEYCQESFGSGGYCRPSVQLSNCDGPAPILVPLPLSLAGDQAVVSLSFVDIDGDAAADLLVGRAGATTLHLGPGDQAALSVPLPDGSAAIDAAYGDFNGDGASDLVVALAPSGAVLLLGDGTGALSPAAAGTLDVPAAAAIAVLDFDGDGALDVALAGASGTVVFRGNGAGDFLESLSLSDQPARAVLASVPSLASASVLVSSDPAAREPGVREWDGGLGFDLEYDALQIYDPGVQSWLPLVVGSGTQRTLVGVGALGANTRLVVGETGPAQLAYVLADPVTDGATGDIDGDGLHEFVLTDGEHLTIVHPGLPGTLDCSDAVTLPGGSFTHLAVGDLNGDGRADVVTATAGVVSAYVSQ